MTTLMPQTAKKPEGYFFGFVALLIAFATLLAALGFEYIGGHVPCPLCLQQRWAYYASIPLLFIALIMLSSEMPRLAALLFFIVALAFLANTGLGIYQAGAEWKYWPGPDTCAGQQGIVDRAGDLLGALEKTKVVRCDEAGWRFLSLSFAGWNAVVSFFIFVLSIMAASGASRMKSA